MRAPLRLLLLARARSMACWVAVVGLTFLTFLTWLCSRVVARALRFGADDARNWRARADAAALTALVAACDACWGDLDCTKDVEDVAAETPRRRRDERFAAALAMASSVAEGMRPEEARHGRRARRWF